MYYLGLTRRYNSAVVSPINIYVYVYIYIHIYLYRPRSSSRKIWKSRYRDISVSTSIYQIYILNIKVTCRCSLAALHPRTRTAPNRRTCEKQNKS